MVYVASTRALAALEELVHLDRSTLLSSFVLIPCEFDERLVTDLDLTLLPDEWRRDPPSSELAAIGDAWIRNAGSAVLAVPGAIIEEEKDFLLNPAHPDFLEIEIGDLNSPHAAGDNRHRAAMKVVNATIARASMTTMNMNTSTRTRRFAMCAASAGA
jgi:RES domain-containing protein